MYFQGGKLSMIIYPAIDIKEGKCVRLIQGKFNDVTVYSDNPVEMALKWESEGAAYLHVVDLDGARTGELQNFRIIRDIASRLSIPVQMGGGIRSLESIEYIINEGIQRVILGTSAVNNPELVKNALKNFENNIAIAIDARDGMVAVEGWEKTSNYSAIDFAKKMEDMGAKTIIYTDISRDGMLAGPNLKAMEEMARSVGIEVIASGGVGSLQDIINLKSTGVAGVIVGKALYTGDINLVQAVSLV